MLCLKLTLATTKLYGIASHVRSSNPVDPGIPPHNQRATRCLLWLQCPVVAIQMSWTDGFGSITEIRLGAFAKTAPIGVGIRLQPHEVN
jgi:hypothetical protein